jgi:predicted ABC-type ATPase
VVLCFIGIADAETSMERVSMRVTQGGHDVPDAKQKARFSRTRENLRRAIRALENVLVFDNQDLGAPFRRVAVFRRGEVVDITEPPEPGASRPDAVKQ